MSRTALLSDEMWARSSRCCQIARRGWSDHRPVVEAICWRYRTGSPWRDLPRDFPSWQAVWWRFDRWAKDGTWDRVLLEQQGQAHAVADLEWVARLVSAEPETCQSPCVSCELINGASTVP
jgi:putative transposase